MSGVSLNDVVQMGRENLCKMCFRESLFQLALSSFQERGMSEKEGREEIAKICASCTKNALPPDEDLRKLALQNKYKRYSISTNTPLYPTLSSLSFSLQTKSKIYC